jgi:hypothetical protein
MAGRCCPKISIARERFPCAGGRRFGRNATWPAGRAGACEIVGDVDILAVDEGFEHRRRIEALGIEVLAANMVSEEEDK